MATNLPSPPTPAWYSLASALSSVNALLRKSVPAVLSGGMSKEESNFLDLGKTSPVDDRESTLRDGIRLMSRGTAEDELRMKKAAIELFHFPEGVSPRLGLKDPPPSTYSAKPEDVVARLLEAKQGRNVHPHSVSALVHGYFNLISLCLYQPDTFGSSGNIANPYLDLSPLYGNEGWSTKKIRMFNGRGTLHPDCFLDDRVQLLPPIVSALLVLWNRNHNFIAHNLFIRFSYKHWRTNPPDEDKLAQDEEIFQIVRRINCLQFQNTISEDILNGLFGLSSDDPSPKFDIVAKIASRPTGQSVRTYKESNLLHTLTPVIVNSDIAIVGAKITEIIGQVHPSELSPAVFKKLYRMFIEDSGQDLTACHYPGLQRDEHTGRFDDNSLYKILHSARSQRAYSAIGEGSVLCSKLFHLQALEDERDWKTCTFNEFRKLYGLKALKSFIAWNPDPDIASAAESLYGDIDKLGLYAGLQCEASSPYGFRLGYTKTYALIVDLITRIRSGPNSMGRSVTLSEKEEYLTTWSSKETQVDWSRAGNGAVLPKVLQRNLPQFYSYNNAYSYFLFSTPDALEESLAIQKSGLIVNQPPDRIIHQLDNLIDVQHVFRQPELYRTTYTDNLAKLTNNYGYLLGFDGSLKDLHYKDRLMTMYALIPDDGALERYAARLRWLTNSAIRKHRQSTQTVFGVAQIDIIGDVINDVCTRWVCETLCDYKLADDDDRSRDGSPNNLRNKTVKEMHEEFANLYVFIFKIFDREDGHEAETRAIRSSEFLQKQIASKIPMPEWLLSKPSNQTWIKQIIETMYDTARKLIIVYFAGIDLKAFTAQTFFERVVKASRLIPIPDMESFIAQRLLSKVQGGEPTQKDHDEAERDIEVSRIVASILGLAAVTAVNFSQACAIVVDFYLDDKYKAEREEIIRLSTLDPNTKETSEERRAANMMIAGYIYEALRISQPLLLWRIAVKDDNINGRAVKAGDMIFADFQQLHNTGDYSDKVDPTRRVDSMLGLGIHKCPAYTQDPTVSFIASTMPEVIRAIFSLGEVSRIPGNPYSALNIVHVHPNASQMDPRAFVNPTGEITYYPRSLLLKYSVASPGAKEKEKDPAKWKAGITPNVFREVTRVTEKILAIAMTLWVVYAAICTSYFAYWPVSTETKLIAIVRLLAFWVLIVVFLGFKIGPHCCSPVKVDQIIQKADFACPDPQTTWDKWGVRTMPAGPHGKPLDISYNSWFGVAHKLMILDADKKDMRFAVYIDDRLIGHSPNITVNKQEDCGIDPNECYRLGFSGVDVIVPAGHHTVRVEWLGNEFQLVNDTKIPDLGKDSSRRILWARDYCGPRNFLTRWFPLLGYIF